jgi:hypothetical protein
MMAMLRIDEISVGMGASGEGFHYMVANVRGRTLIGWDSGAAESFESAAQKQRIYW